MAKKSFLYLSLVLFLVACKAQPPFNFEEYEEDDDEDSETVTTVSSKVTTKAPTKGQSDSNSTARAIAVSAQAKQNKPKQEEVEDETEAPAPVTTPRASFGPQVASIISGALSGNLGSILSGSFNLVSNTNSRENVNKAWESIAGITSTSTRAPVTTRRSTVASTTEAEDDDEDAEGSRIA